MGKPRRHQKQQTYKTMYEPDLASVPTDTLVKYQEFIADSHDRDYFIIQNVAEDNACFFRAIGNGLFHITNAPSQDSDDVLYSVGCWKLPSDMNPVETYATQEWGYDGVEQTNIAKKIQQIARQWLLIHAKDNVVHIPGDYKVVDLIRDLHDIDIADDDVLLAFYDECYRTFAGKPRKLLKRASPADGEDQFDSIPEEAEQEPESLGFCAIQEEDNESHKPTEEYDSDESDEPSGVQTRSQKQIKDQLQDHTSTVNPDSLVLDSTAVFIEEMGTEPGNCSEQELSDNEFVYDNKNQLPTEPVVRDDSSRSLEYDVYTDEDMTEDLIKDLGLVGTPSPYHEVLREKIQAECNLDSYWDRWGSGAEAYALSQFFKIPIIVYEAKRFNFRTSKFENGRLYKNEKPDKNVRFRKIQVWGAEFQDQAPPIELLYKKVKKNIEHYMVLYRTPTL